MCIKFENLDQTIQRYLDGNLSEEARQTFEEFYFCDDAVFGKLRFEYELMRVIKIHGKRLLDNDTNHLFNE